MPFILSPEQKVVVDTVLRSETSSTKYFDIDTALQALCKICVNALNDGKKILIHIPDRENQLKVQQILQKTGLIDISINVSDDHPMPESDVIKLRSTIKKDNEVDSIIQHTLLSKKEAHLDGKIANFYKALDTTVLTDTPFRDFTANAIYNKKSGRPDITIKETRENDLTFTTSEFYKIKKDIKQGIDLFQNAYELYDHLSLFNDSIWEEISTEKIKSIGSTLSEIKRESEELASTFISVSNALLQNSSKHLNETFSNLEQRIDKHEEACLAFHISLSKSSKDKDGILSIFKKNNAKNTNKVYVEAFDQLSSTIKEISPEWYEELDAPKTEEITFEYISAFLIAQKEKAIYYQKQLKENIEAMVIRINKINTDSNDVKKLDERLNALIEKINASNIFDLKIDHNILSFSKQSELIDNIAEYLRKCDIVLNSSDGYIKWKSFYNRSSETFKRIFNEIKRLNKNQWLDAFEKWYELNLQNNVLGSAHISRTSLESLYELNQKCSNVEVAKSIAKLHESRILGSEQLKKTSKELYNTLFKKKQMPSVSWKNTALMNRGFMQSFFPIHTSESLACAKEYDLVISLDKASDSEPKPIHYFAPIESSDIQNSSLINANFLYLNHYNYTGKLINLSSTEKLKASKKLAKYVLSLNQDSRIYQLKNANIISLLPAYDANYLEQELDKIGAKSIDTQGVLYDRLTESILMTSRRPFLIVKNELINDELYEHKVWQLKILQLFKEAGYKIVSLNTIDQLANNKQQIDNIIQEVKGKEDNSIQNIEKIETLHPTPIEKV